MGFYSGKYLFNLQALSCLGVTGKIAKNIYLLFVL
jgi:hypothetical protein